MERVGKQLSSLGDRVRRARHARKLSQAALARLVGVTQPLISSLECGKHLGTTKLLLIAGALQVRPEWLLSGEGEMSLGSGAMKVRGAPSAIQRITARTSDEIEILEGYRHLNRKQRTLIRQTIIELGNA